MPSNAIIDERQRSHDVQSARSRERRQIHGNLNKSHMGTRLVAIRKFTIQFASRFFPDPTLCFIYSTEGGSYDRKRRKDRSHTH